MLIYILLLLKEKKHEIQAEDIPKLQANAHQSGNQVDIKLSRIWNNLLIV